MNSLVIIRVTFPYVILTLATIGWTLKFLKDLNGSPFLNALTFTHAEFTITDDYDWNLLTAWFAMAVYRVYIDNECHAYFVVAVSNFSARVERIFHEKLR